MANNFAIINVNKNNKKTFATMGIRIADLPGGVGCTVFRKQDSTLIKKENQIFLIREEIQNGAVAMSYMTNDLLIYGEILAHFLIS